MSLLITESPSWPPALLLPADQACAAGLATLRHLSLLSPGSPVSPAGLPHTHPAGPGDPGTAYLESYRDKCQAAIEAIGGDPDTVGKMVAALTTIIYASDGCRGHAQCNHDMNGWKLARAILVQIWAA